MLHLAATRALRRPGRFQQQQRLLFARFSSSTDGGRRGGNGSSSSSSSWWHQHLGLLTIAGLAIADLIVLPTTTEYINDFKGAQAIAQGNGRALLPSREASDLVRTAPPLLRPSLHRQVLSLLGPHLTNSNSSSSSSSSSSGGRYYVMCGEAGTGKSTLAKAAAREMGKGVIYVDVSSSQGDLPTAIRLALGGQHRLYHSLLLALRDRLLALPPSLPVPTPLEEAVNALSRATRRASSSPSSSSASSPVTVIFDGLDSLKPSPSSLLELQSLLSGPHSSPSFISLLVLPTGLLLGQLRQHPAWSSNGGVVVVDDLDKQEAVALLRGEGGHEGGRFSKAVASQVYALVGGNVAHLARAVELMEGEGWGLEELALDAYQSMRAGFDRLVSLNPPSFSPSSSPSSSSSFSVAPPPSSPPGQRLLEALIQSPSRQLSLQAASASLNLDVSQLVERHSPILALDYSLPHASYVRFRSPLAERCAHVYLMVREGGREDEVLQWFVSVLQRAAGGGRDGKSGDGMGCSSSSGGRMKELARRVKSEGRGRGGEEVEGRNTELKRNATLVLVASSLALLYVAVGGGGGGSERGGGLCFPITTESGRGTREFEEGE